ncbi:hypothetical protein VRY85_09145 [Achromobacter sp. F4_2707]|uniref:hypothetical protein n=1 Tax=Achromobacter sp. F4_2707 TaxID=3114286 RepID=UPI0039C73801
MKTYKSAAPFKWPFPPAPKAQGKAPGKSSVKKHKTAVPGTLSRKGMLVDVVMVICWGASIPGLMWLGAAGGF